ncbi:endonuclease/exonuclease/phosphatase family protein [Rhizobium sp. CC-YZS058]|uniref:endonuclease/exonuclease/phosphatase family protein n=1 Tax=Rhizobium sp. CC-YZS058 TaxID=3042153 RepID=UPI002B057D35|nr:endonuclease/exonuclease/phosphatase family protein [Rhizobium sp. CC-YZS058]MEA3535320.1 endonuclease/exonuclease/phosphatase family protein [Rhizobium sp. CC-YZS058]
MRLVMLALLPLSFLLAAPCLAAGQTTMLTVMSFNIYGGGQNDDTPLSQTADVIRKVDPDIIGIQETRPEAEDCDANACPPAGKSVAAALAKELGYHCYDQTKTNAALWANAILSRYPIRKATANDLGVEIDVAGRKVYAFSLHLTDFPYQPYQLLDISYGDAPFLKTADEAIAAARAARGPALDLLEKDLSEAKDAAATFVVGDFNEPSHLDWTPAAVAAGRQPLAVAWPSSERLVALGFTDLFRAAFPDPVAKPGLTWTPVSEATDPQDHHDRIDFTYGRGKSLRVIEAGIVGEAKPAADIAITPWPSDHRATMATVSF